MPTYFRRVTRRRFATAPLIRGDFCYARRPFIDYLRAGGANLQHLFGADSTTAETQASANIAGRQGLLRMLLS